MLQFLTVLSVHSSWQVHGNLFWDSGDLLGRKFQNWLRFDDWVGGHNWNTGAGKNSEAPKEELTVRQVEPSRISRLWSFREKAWKKDVSEAGSNSGLSWYQLQYHVWEIPAKTKCEPKDLLLPHSILQHYWGLCRDLGHHGHRNTCCLAQSTRMELSEQDHHHWF